MKSVVVWCNQGHSSVCCLGCKLTRKLIHQFNILSCNTVMSQHFKMTMTSTIELKLEDLERSVTYLADQNISLIKSLDNSERNSQKLKLRIKNIESKYQSQMGELLDSCINFESRLSALEENNVQNIQEIYRSIASINFESSRTDGRIETLLDKVKRFNEVRETKEFHLVREIRTLKDRVSFLLARPSQVISMPSNGFGSSLLDISQPMYYPGQALFPHAQYPVNLTNFSPYTDKLCPTAKEEEFPNNTPPPTISYCYPQDHKVKPSEATQVVKDILDQILKDSLEDILNDADPNEGKRMFQFGVQVECDESLPSIDDPTLRNCLCKIHDKASETLLTHEELITSDFGKIVIKSIEKSLGLPENSIALIVGVQYQTFTNFDFQIDMDTPNVLNLQQKYKEVCQNVLSSTCNFKFPILEEPTPVTNHKLYLTYIQSFSTNKEQSIKFHLSKSNLSSNYAPLFSLPHCR